MVTYHISTAHAVNSYFAIGSFTDHAFAAMKKFMVRPLTGCFYSIQEVLGSPARRILLIAMVHFNHLNIVFIGKDF